MCLRQPEIELLPVDCRTSPGSQAHFSLTAKGSGEVGFWPASCSLRERGGMATEKQPFLSQHVFFQSLFPCWMQAITFLQPLSTSKQKCGSLTLVCPGPNSYYAGMGYLLTGGFRNTWESPSSWKKGHCKWERWKKWAVEGRKKPIKVFINDNDKFALHINILYASFIYMNYLLFAPDYPVTEWLWML